MGKSWKGKELSIARKTQAWWGVGEMGRSRGSGADRRNMGKKLCTADIEAEDDLYFFSDEIKFVEKSGSLCIGKELHHKGFDSFLIGRMTKTRPTKRRPEAQTICTGYMFQSAFAAWFVSNKPNPIDGYHYPKIPKVIWAKKRYPELVIVPSYFFKLFQVQPPAPYTYIEGEAPQHKFYAMGLDTFFQVDPTRLRDRYKQSLMYNDPLLAAIRNSTRDLYLSMAALEEF